MPAYAGPKGEPWGPKRVVAAALGLAMAVGCLDLSIPTVPSTPPPPSLTVLAPKAGDTISLTAEVAVEAESVNGVTTVTLFCGPLDGARSAYAWGAPPYLALVDLSVCEGLTEKNPDGGLPLLLLTVQAVSGADGGAVQSLRVSLDATGPIVQVVYPPTAQPKSPFTVLVSPVDAGLSSFPVVMLAGQPADSVTAIPNPDGGLPTYEAFFQSTPGLGIDNYKGGQPVPIEVLTDTDEVVRLSVNATSPNGNTTAIDLSVGLTRLVWDRYIPGQPASSGPVTWAAEPVAFGNVLKGGLVLPLATTSGGGATAPWIPGVLSFADGTFYGFDVTTIGGLDGGYLARGLNAQGQTLFFEFTGKGSNLLLAPPPPATKPVVTGTLPPPQVIPPLTAVSSADGGPDLLCLQDAVPVCGGAVTESLTCFTPQLVAVTVVSAATTTGGPDAGVVAGAGGSYLSPNVALCGNSWNLVDLTHGTVSFGPLGDPNGVPRACFVSSITRLLAVGDGTFVVQLVSTCDVTGIPEYPILRVGPGAANAASAILGAYTAPLGTARPVNREVVGVLVDGRVVTLNNAPPNTTFELWSEYPASLPDAGVASIDIPEVTSPIAGLFDSADAVLNTVVAKSVYSGVDGSFAVMLSGAPLGVGVLAFGPGLQPRWLYLYPRLTSTSFARLVSASSVGDVYLVDEFNNRAESLRVVPPAPPDAGVQPPSTLTYSTNPAVYTKGTPITPNVPTTTGGTPTSYGVSPALPAGLSLSSATGDIAGTPTVVTATASYTVTASNPAGSATVTLTIAVNDAPPTGLTYSNNPAVYTAGSSIAANVPSYTGGAPTAYTVSPALPAGLSLNAVTGVISGTPSAVSGTAVYTVTAANAAGSTTASVTITVQAVAVDGGTCGTLCLAVYPPAVQVVSNTGVTVTLGGSAAPTFTGNVNVTLDAGSPFAGTTVTFSPNPPSSVVFTSGAASTLSSFLLTADNGFTAGTAQVTVTGTSTTGGLTDIITFTVNIGYYAVNVYPNPASVVVSNTLLFTAQVDGVLPAPTVTWSVDEGSAGGTFNPTLPGQYSAPTTTGTYHVRATDNSNPNVYGEAVVTVTGG